MNKLTDFKMCKRIAEIEGYEVVEHEGYKCCAKKDDLIRFIPFDPLAEYTGMIFRLMIKHKVVLYPECDGTYLSKIVGCEIGSKDACPRRSICLAIIEHNEGG